MKKWYFPYGKDIEKESVNNARIETFKDNILESLARETCQNSLDASYNNQTVNVVFESKIIDSDLIPNKNIFLEEIIPLSKKTWEHDKNALEFLNTYRKLLNQNQIKVLRISDYNTTGLIEGNWESLIETAGSPFNSDPQSAGSFGIGKAAPFASSDLRMVFYNTQLPNGDKKSMGVTRFVSYDKPDGMTAQGVGYLGSHEKKPLLSNISFGFPNRTQPGTDIYIMGFNQDDNWSSNIKTSLLQNFMLAIYQEKLIVKIEDDLISKKTMKDAIYKLSNKDGLEVKNYYSVLEDPDKKVIYLDDRFKKYGLNPKDGILLLSKKENANRSILMTRKAGMKIFDRKNISGSIQFNGIFQALGGELNETLRIMENPNHDNWIASRYKKNPKKAQEFLDDLGRFAREHVRNSFQEKIENKVDAFGLNKFLPNLLQDTDGSDDKTNKEDSFKRRIKKIKLKDRDTSKKTKIPIEGLTEEEIEQEMSKGGYLEGGDDGFSHSDDTHHGPRTEKPGKPLNPHIPGPYQSSPEGNRMNPKKFYESKNLKGKIIEIDFKNGLYRLIISGKSKSDYLKIKVELISESGQRYKEEISFSGKEISIIEAISDNEITIKNPKNNIMIIDFKIPYKKRIKMGVKIYENR